MSKHGITVIKGPSVIAGGMTITEGAKGDRNSTIASSILKAHNQGSSEDSLNIKFDSLTSHDITFVGIIQTARAGGLKTFPVPYVMTNCHNSLCAVGGTINEDDHHFGLSAAKKYGGIFVPAHQAVIHQYNREMMAGCGKMILGSDSHTRYGALGTMAIGEGGPELVKQLLERTYDVPAPDVMAIYLDGTVRPGVGPHDVALAIIGEVFQSGFVKNCVMEFVGPGIEGLSIDFRNGIDVMTTETTCLTSIWMTDDKVKEYFTIHNRPSDYKKLSPGDDALYDGLVKVDLSAIEPMIAMPFHPGNVHLLRKVAENPKPFLEAVETYAYDKLGADKSMLDLLPKINADGKLVIDQAIIAGCAGGTYENCVAAAEILDGKNIGSSAFSLSVYPQSQPVGIKLAEDGVIAKLMKTGAIIRSAFCGPCFGAGDTPSNNSFSIRHTTRNFPSREGSKPGDKQMSAVALMDARSIAATAANQGILTPADSVMTKEPISTYTFDASIYENRVYNGWGNAKPELELVFGPNIIDWPTMLPMPENLLLSVASYITDPVTTTDELIPSGETSSYRSNPLRLAEFTLSRKDPEYVGKAKVFNEFEERRRAVLNGTASADERKNLFEEIKTLYPFFTEAELDSTAFGSLIYAVKPGDGSAREQAASCQKVLGGWANIAQDYATKRYRSNVINWGMIPFVLSPEDCEHFSNGDMIHFKGIRRAIADGDTQFTAITNLGKELNLTLPGFTPDERKVVLAGCLINSYAGK